MEAEGRFEQAFNFEYHRNNKANGQKNLRCFPSCNETGHANCGFCGHPITCWVKGLALPAAGAEMFSVAEFCLADEDSQFVVGNKYSCQNIESQIRLKEQPLLQFIQGDVRIEDSLVKVVFNTQLLGYHYGWTSNKHTCDSSHAFRAHLFLRSPGEDEVEYIDHLDSSAFKVYSRRRTRPGRPPSMEETQAVRQKGIKRMRSSEGLQESRQSVISRHSSGLDRFGSQENSPHVNQIGQWQPPREPLKKKSPTAMLCPQGLSQTEVHNGRPETLVGSEEELKSNLIIDRLCHLVFHFSGSRMPHGGSRNPTYTPSQRIPWGDEGSSIYTGETLINFMDVFEEYDHETDGAMSSHQPMSREPSSCGYSESSYRSVPEISAKSPALKHTRPDPSPDVTCLELFYRLLDQHGFPNAGHIISSLHTISEAIIAEAPKSNSFTGVIQYWSSPEGLRKLKSQIEQEKSTDFEWTRQRELETFRRNQSLESSLFAEIRQSYRNLLVKALQITGLHLEMFESCLELAAKHHFIAPDPFYPPDVKSASFLHAQLHGNLDRFDTQDYGSRQGQFKNAAQQHQYAKDIILMKREIFRKVLCNRIIQDQRLKHTPEDDQDGPVHPNWNIAGTWVSTGEYQELRQQLISSLWSNVSGLKFGMFYGKIFNALFSRLNILQTEKTLTLKGQKMLVVDPTLSINMGGPAKPFRIPIPMPIGSLAPLLIERTLIGWYSTSTGGVPTVNTVFSGPAFHACANPIREHTQSHGEQHHLPPSSNSSPHEMYHIPSHEEVSKFIKSKRPPDAEDMPEIRVRKTFFLLPCHTQLKLIDSFYIFPSKSLAPPIEDFEAHAKMDENPNCLRLLRMECIYTRATTQDLQET